MIRSFYSTEKETDLAVDDICKKMAHSSPMFVLYFASPHYNASLLSDLIQKAFPEAKTAGCTTAGELVNDLVLSESLVVMAFSKAALSACAVGVVSDLNICDLDECMQQLEMSLGQPMDALDPLEYVGIVLPDGMSGREEHLLNKINRRTGVTFIGGSAGDGLKFECTHIFANGISFAQGAVLIVLRPKYGFDFIKTQSFERNHQCTLCATSVDDEKRIVHEFNGIPARTAYADAVGLPADKVHEAFESHPIGMILDDEIYVRSPKKFEGDSLHFYCSVLEGAPLQLLQSKDIVEDTGRAIEEKVVETRGNIAAIINFHCILRTLELRRRGLEASYGQLFSRFPTIGFSTYGEQLFWHVNQTSTMLVFLGAPTRGGRRGR